MKRCMLIAMLLCVTIAGFAKRDKIYLDDRFRSLMPPIEAYIDGRVLEFEIAEELGTLDIIIEDVSGNVVYSSSIEGNGTVPLVLDLKDGEYVLVVTSEELELWGDFKVEI